MRTLLEPREIRRSWFTVDLNAKRDAEIARAEELLEKARAVPEPVKPSEAHDRWSAQIDAVKAGVARISSRPNRDVHHFALPAHSAIQYADEFYEARPEGFGRGVEQAALLIGMGWRHLVLDLEAIYPAADPSVAALAVYADQVQLELQEEGYRVEELLDLALELQRHNQHRQAEQGEAAALAGFTQPPAVSSTA
ncbi:MAG: hypothetical protein GY925_26400 [Actinomycetia bacterium]|nr:hypothetical protein [Actinomycetes bacterium]